MREDRPYQSRAKEGVRRGWLAGHRATCLVAPTGSGKTHMASSLALEHGGEMLWTAHRSELVSQAYEALHSMIGGSSMGVVIPGHSFAPGARVQVGTVQSLLARAPNLNPSIIVLDEAHHYVSDEWAALAQRFPDARILGPTATPQRGDGRPLGDLFTNLVVAATYSELIVDGFLCDAACYQPPEALSGGFAMDPVEAWKRYSSGMSGFAFMPSIREAEKLCAAFNAVGIKAVCIHAKTKKKDRREHLRAFAAGEVEVVCNVDTMTEGVDVPRAGVAMLGRSFLTVSAFLQACGRVLRPWPGKEYARIIDLTGATILHCPPTIDRVYSLDGEGIRKSDSAENPVRNCQECGLVYACEQTCCPACGAPPPPRVKRPSRIFSLELQEVWAGEHTKEDAKLREYKRLRGVQREKKLELDWVIQEYKRLFGTKPRLIDVTPQEKKHHFHKMSALGRSKGLKPGFAASKFKDMFGHWPSGRDVN